MHVARVASDDGFDANLSDLVCSRAEAYARVSARVAKYLREFRSPAPRTAKLLRKYRKIEKSRIACRQLITHYVRARLGTGHYYNKWRKGTLCESEMLVKYGKRAKFENVLTDEGTVVTQKRSAEDTRKLVCTTVDATKQMREEYDKLAKCEKRMKLRMRACFRADLQEEAPST